ncbi:MAG: B12-binding domain-containing radical SAM protein [Desulfosudaceae bacterium]
MERRVLLSSVFKPFGVDSIYGRKESRIELYHNQLTKSQGIFSMRSFMDSFGLHAIANNIDTPATVLDYPSLPRFVREIKKGYDIVGIGAIVPNFQKVKKMVELVREHAPRSRVVLGGFCAVVPDIEKMLKVDHVCVGEGISFMRSLLGLSPEFVFKNPDVFNRDREILGVPLPGARTPQVVVGLGCSYGCDFCSPSHFFGRRHIRFFRSGRSLFQEVTRVTRLCRSDTVGLIGDDNFLLDADRAEEFRRCVVDSGQVLNLFIFGSADRVRAFGVERLVEMGVSLIWIGRESSLSQYPKNEKVDLPALVAELQQYGIRVILSSILLLDEHTRDNIEADIDDHLACQPVFSQFSFYAPMPGTPLYERLSAARKIMTAIPFEEWHAFKQPWFIHPHFDLKEAEKIQEHAYRRDFEELGPSLARFIEVEYQGWENLINSSKPHLVARAKAIAARMPRYRQLLLAVFYLLPPGSGRTKVAGVLSRVESSFGRRTAVDRAVAGGLYLTGRFREIRTRCFGDALQPRTRVVYYNGRR